MRGRLVAGNWKMHGNRVSNLALLNSVLAGIGGLEGVACAVCVPFPYLGEVAARLKGSPLAWGAQNLSEHAQGAYTGRGFGGDAGGFRLPLRDRRAFRAAAVVRRDATRTVAAKFAAAQASGLTPILCVGETLEERDAGRTEQVVARQLDAVLTRVQDRRRGAGLRTGVGDRHRADGDTGAGAGGAWRRCASAVGAQTRASSTAAA